MTKKDRYIAAFREIEIRLDDGGDRIADLGNTAAVLKKRLDFYWVGFYFLRDGKLVLGPFQGTPACVFLSLDAGVCAGCVRERNTLIVSDVHAFAGHVACDPHSKSEIVVPLVDASGCLWAVLDVDSDRLDAFDSVDQEGLEQIVALLRNRWNGCADAAHPTPCCCKPSPDGILMSVPKAFSDSSLSIASWAVLDSRILSDWKTWFDAHVDSFVRHHTDAVENLELKREHTHYVCREIQDVGRSLGLSPAQLNLAEALALFHDVGRFRQYARYSTFVDARSEDHAALGVRVVCDAEILSSCNDDIRNLILFAIGHHNRADLPADADPTQLFFTRLLRDADKLDIWRVVTDHYRQCREKPNTDVTLDMPDTSEISEAICADLLAGRIAGMTDIRTVNDFKLLQLGWAFDLNFDRSFQLLRERSYLEQIRAALPDDPRVDAIYSKVTACVHSHVSSTSQNDDIVT